MKIAEDSPQVSFPPPLMALICIMLGYGIHRLFPLSITNEPLWFTGTFFVLAGLASILSCAFLFKTAHTRLEPWETTSAIVKQGPYHITRNPIYLAFIFISIGIALYLNTWWIIFFQPVLIIVLTKYVIEREENYLEKKFGEDYLRYKREVRRWL